MRTGKNLNLDYDKLRDFQLTLRNKLIAYLYTFLGDLDLESMRTAGALLVGSHDFRNFCKMDVGNAVVEFIRRLDAVYVEELASAHSFNSPTLNQSSLQV